MPDSHLPRKFLRLLKPRVPQMLATLRRFVNAESPSLEKAAADRCCGVIAEEWNKHGARAERIPQKRRGDLIGITHALYALQALQQAEIPVRKRLVFHWTSDEDVGRESSRKLFETEARRSDAVFVLEPA